MLITVGVRITEKIHVIVMLTNAVKELRKERGEQAFVGSGYSAPPLSDKDRRIRELEAQLRETERANEILKEALGFFAKGRKK